MEIIIKTPVGKIVSQSMEFGDEIATSNVELVNKEKYFATYKVNGGLVTVRINSDADVELNRIIGKPATLTVCTNDLDLFDKVKEITKEKENADEKM